MNEIVIFDSFKHYESGVITIDQYHPITKRSFKRFFRQYFPNITLPWREVYKNLFRDTNSRSLIVVNWEKHSPIIAIWLEDFYAAVEMRVHLYMNHRGLRQLLSSNLVLWSMLLERLPAGVKYLSAIIPEERRGVLRFAEKVGFRFHRLLYLSTGTHVHVAYFAG